GTHRARAVHGYTLEPLVMSCLHDPRAYVVDYRVAEDVSQRTSSGVFLSAAANHHSEYDLVCQAGCGRTVEEHRFVRSDNGGRRLCEELRHLGDVRVLVAGNIVLLDMLGVVASDAEYVFRRAWDRGEQSCLPECKHRLRRQVLALGK